MGEKKFTADSLQLTARAKTRPQEFNTEVTASTEVTENTEGHREERRSEEAKKRKEKKRKR
jgi:hypothetical protein